MRTRGAVVREAPGTYEVLELDELVTTTYALDDVAQGYEDMHAGRNLRGVVVHEH